jgi:two-component system nitrogen regulation response regulator NtrX
VLIVDDEASIRRSLAGILSDEGYRTAEAPDGDAALAEMRGDAMPDAVLLDIAMPGRDGVAVLEELQRSWPSVPVVMMSGHGTIETAVRATQLGAFDFLEKPLSIEKLLLTLRHALERSRLERENQRLRAEAVRAHEILGESAVIQKLKEQIRIAAPTNGWVLITGENGTGKELVARQVHVQSRRSEQPFVEVNCAAIPEELIESELFGHEKGAFTGAIVQKRGKFELADRGTIFLDEIADMSLRTQAKILRILQEHRFERVGGTETLEVNVRVIAATNKDLREEIAAARFREDLFYRISRLPIHIPPLRERREDIPPLVEHLTRLICRENNLRPRRFSGEAAAALAGRSWPGNVRELRNTLERAIILSPRDVLEPADLPGAEEAPARDDERWLFAPTLREFKEQAEREYLRRRLEQCGWNVTRTARAIGTPRSNLYKRLEHYGLTRLTRGRPGETSG